MSQYFNLTLDTTAPTGCSLSGLSSYYNSAATVTVTSVEDAVYMKVWVNKNALGTTSDPEFPANWSAKASSATLTPSTEGTNYFHAIFMDAVGNIGAVVDSSSFIYDTTGPTISNVENPARVNVKTVTVKVTASDAKEGIDAVSGVSSTTITGTDAHIAEQVFTWDDTDRTNGYKECSVALTLTQAEEEGTTPITCGFSVASVDRAGNAATTITGKQVIYDAFPASATMTLMDKTCASTLPQYVNAYDYGVQITSSDTDISSFKVWEGDTEPTEWEDWTGSPQKIQNLTFSTGEGTKTIHGKIKDTTGNVTTLTNCTATVDTTAPVVTLTADKTVISSMSGYNTVTFTYAATDTHTMPNYELYVGSTKVKNGTFTTGMTEEVTAADIKGKSGGTAGEKSMTLKVQDIAGNWGTSSAIIITIDETAPTGSVAARTYYNNVTGDAAKVPAKVKITATDTGGSTMDKMKIWVDSATGTYETYVEHTDFTYSLGDLADGQHTVHAQFKDAVGNESLDYTATFTVDTVAPTATPSLDNVEIISGSDAYTKILAHTVTLNATDATSSVVGMKVWGDIDGASAEPDTYETYAATKSITLTTGDGIKALHFKFKDAAGNETAQIEYGYTLHLDQELPSATIILRKSDDSANLPAKVSARPFAARISSDDSQEAAGLMYMLSGDLTEPSVDWIPYDEEEGQTYMLISGLDLTENDGTKTITVTFKDAAGNEKSASASVVYDTALPVVTVTDPNYSVVSKVNAKRRNADGSEMTVPTGGDEKDIKTDFIKFTWSCNENLEQYKVCVNDKDQTAAGAVAIGTTYGSVNMTGNAVTASSVVTCYINGKDYAATDKVNEKDGVYEVIVYGFDGTNWSAVHSI